MTSVAIHVDQLFFGAPGGIGTYIRELTPALARQDPSLDVTLFHSSFPEQLDAPEPWMRDFRSVAIPGSYRTLYPRWSLTGRPALPDQLRHAALIHAASPAAVPPIAPGQKLVVTVHDLAFEVVPRSFPQAWRTMFKAGLRATVKRADAILTPSRNTAEDLISRTDVDPTKIHVVPLAASLEQGSADPTATIAQLKVPQPYVLYVGTLEPRKNLVRLVRAYRRAAANGVPHALVLAGPLGYQGPSLLREIKLAGPGDVVLTGPLDAADRDALYRGASAFLYPSLYEGFGLPVLEAMARGVPTVTSDTSSLPEVAGDASIAVDPRSVRAIEAAIERIVMDEALAEKLSIRGRSRSERFSWDETARLTLEVYDRLTGAK